ncbi:hypothetical protein VTN77DRAFT_1600 [Rasamsonia byssochlamydoides]|uniref:uncharacterized protein n=1 Tax=Rasamsonia byssochlamydoides TaxID=89139 RepID=UPI00374243F7
MTIMTPFEIPSASLLLLAVLVLASSVTAYNATGSENSTLTVWNPSANAYQPISFMLNAGVTEGIQTNTSSSNSGDTYVTTEAIWLTDAEGHQVCNAPYTLCALAFTGGISNSSLIAQMQSDTGNCATAFSSTCIGDLSAAVGNAVLDQANNNGTDASICVGLSKAIEIPESCSETESVLSQSTSQALLTTSSFCSNTGDQPFTISSFTAPSNQLGSVLGQYDEYIESFTPILLVAFGGPSGIQIVAQDPAHTRTLTCVRPGTVTQGSRKPGAASSNYAVPAVWTVALIVGSVVAGLVF